MLQHLYLLSLLLLALSSLAAEDRDNILGRITSEIDLGTARNWGIRCSNGLELSHQRELEHNEQLEFNLGLSTNHRHRDYDLIVNGTYQWSYPLSNLDELEWYTGPTLHCGYYDLSTSAQLNLALGGQIGIAYWGYHKLQFTLDLRPAYYLLYGRNMELNIGLGIRYLL